jgi:hypothetical protein
VKQRKTNADYRRTYRQRHADRIKAQDAAYYRRNAERKKMKRCVESSSEVK